MPGAAYLAGVGALRAGAGVLRIATCQSSTAQIGVALPEARVFGCSQTRGGGIDPANGAKLLELAETASAVLIGPGMIDEGAVEQLVPGAATHIVSYEGEEWLSEHGTVGLATSGSGDTLAGILAGLLARGAAPALATVWSVYLHAEAGHRLAQRQGTFGFLAGEILAEIPAIMADFAE
jgi:NAD(P)H-hydrate repair Nnr-like enzyme with NAD(P)H-hydrate dehydratase domain